MVFRWHRVPVVTNLKIQEEGKKDGIGDDEFSQAIQRSDRSYDRNLFPNIISKRSTSKRSSIFLRLSFNPSQPLVCPCCVSQLARSVPGSLPAITSCTSSRQIACCLRLLRRPWDRLYLTQRFTRACRRQYYYRRGRIAPLPKHIPTLPEQTPPHSTSSLSFSLLLFLSLSLVSALSSLAHQTEIQASSICFSLFWLVLFSSSSIANICLLTLTTKNFDDSFAELSKLLLGINRAMRFNWILKLGENIASYFQTQLLLFFCILTRWIL